MKPLSVLDIRNIEDTNLYINTDGCNKIWMLELQIVIIRHKSEKKIQSKEVTITAFFVSINYIA